MEQYKEYFAFISYKREDEVWAKWFQNELESYHLPSSFLNGRSDIPQSFRPVFRDIDELKAGNLPEQIYEALESSINLVVICSPLSAKSPWVNKEITDFIEIGKKKNVDNLRNIFPFIIDGIPHSHNETECFPEALEKLPSDKDIVGGNVNEGGNVSEENRERAFVKVLAGMLPKDISFSMLWDKYERDKIKKEQEEKEQREKLQIMQSKFLTENARQLINKGNLDTAYLLLLEALPKNVDNPERPLLEETVNVLRHATESDMEVIDCEHSPISTMISPDGKFLAAYLKNNTIEVWLFKTSVPYLTIDLGNSKKKKVKFYSFICNSNLLIVYPKGYEIWDIDKKEQTLCHVERMHITMGALLKDYVIMISNIDANSYEIRTWDFNNCCYLESFPIFKPSAIPISISSGGQYYTTSNNENMIFIRKVENGEIYHILKGHHGKIKHTSFSPNGQRLVSVGEDYSIRVWEINEEKETLCVKTDSFIDSSISDRQKHESKILEGGGLELKLLQEKSLEEVPQLRISRRPNMALFDRSGKFIYVANENGHIYVLNSTNGEVLKTLSGHHGSVDFIEFSPHYECLVSSSSDGTIRKWMIEDNNHSAFVDIVKNPQNAFFSYDGKKVVSTKKHSKEICVYNISTNDIKIINTKEQVKMAVFSRDNSHIIARLQDDKIQIWNLESKTCINTFLISMTRDTPKNMGLKNYKEQRVAYDMNLISKLPDMDEEELFKIETSLRSKQPIVLNNKTSSLKTIPWIATSPDGKQILMTDKNLILIIELSSGKKTRTLSGHKESVSSASFSPDGRFVISASLDKTIRIWDLNREVNTRCLEGHTGNITYAEFSPNGKYIISASKDRTVRIWSFNPSAEIEELRTLHGHIYDTASFNENNTRVVTVSSQDKILLVWDWMEKKRILRIDGKALTSAFFNPLVDKILTLSNDVLSILNFDSPQLWSLQELIEKTNKRIKNRQLTPEERKKYYLE